MRFKVRAQLMTAFVATSLIGAAAGFLGMHYVGAESADMVELNRSTLGQLKGLFSIYGDVLALEPAVRSLGALENLDTNLAIASSKVGEIDAALSGLTARPQAASFSPALDAFASTWKDYKSGLASLAAAAKERKKADASAAMILLIGSVGSQLDGDISQMINAFIGSGQTIAVDAGKKSSKASAILLALLLAGVAASILLGNILASSFSSHLRLGAAAAARIAGKELDVDVDPKAVRRKDEIGDFARALAGMARDLSGQILAIRSAVKDLSDVGLSLEESMRSADRAAETVTQTIQGVSDHIVSQSAGVEETAATIHSMMNTIETLDGVIERQTQSISSASSSIEQMVGNTGSIANDVERLGTSFDELMAASESGGTKLDGVLGLISKIAAESDKLQETNAIVEEIATRTNLLAMNAAIEAAHAGESGKGFAVVADEIRGLAESASEQSKEISRDINGIRQSIEAAVESSTDTRAAFAIIVGLLRNLESLEHEIVLSLNEQRTGSRQALEGLSSIKEVTAMVHSGSQELREGSKAIDSETSELETATRALRDASREIAHGAELIAGALSAVDELSHRNKEAIASVSDMLRRYSLGAA